jgi:hypothetical protein
MEMEGTDAAAPNRIYPGLGVTHVFVLPASCALIVSCSCALA